MENVSKFLIPKKEKVVGAKTRKYFPYGANVRTWHSNISHYYRNTSIPPAMPIWFLFFCFDRYLNQWHFTHMILIGTRGLKWTSQTGHWIHGFFCCKCILAQMKIIQLGLFWLDQNCRFFVCKIDCFLESFLNPKKWSILLWKNL